MASGQLLIGTGLADQLAGGEGDDTLLGLAGNDYVSGGAGGDLLIGNLMGVGNDTLVGGEGDDTLWADSGENSLDGGAGADLLIADDGNDTLIGGDGADTLLAGDGANRLEGGDGADALIGGHGDDTIAGGADDDLLIGGAGADSLDGGDGSDWIVVDDQDLAADGGDGYFDMAVIAAGAASLGAIDLGQAGNQNLSGDGPVLSGFEAVDAGEAPTAVEIFGAVHHGGLGNLLSGSGFADTLHGSAGADLLAGRGGDDSIEGGNGDDTLDGGEGSDTAVYAGDLAGYEISEEDGVVSIQALIGGEGLDRLTGIEWLRFGDQLYETAVLLLPPENQPPEAADDAIELSEDGSLTFSPLANDSDADGDPLSLSGIVVAPAHGIVTVNGNDSLTYTPMADFPGSDSLVYRVEDGKGGSATATVSISVDAANDPPVAAADNVAVAEDTTVTFQPKNNDSDIDGDTLTINAILSGPTHGTVAINLDNTLSYTPAANYFGADNLVYQVTDSHGGTASATVSITVSSMNDPPMAVADTVSTDAGQAATFSPLANDSDVDGDALSISAIAASPAHGSVVINPGGSLTYTPAAGYSGSDSLTYTVSDGHGGSANATVSITVDPVLVENALWVGPGETYTRLSDAIAASQDGDTIYVRAGTYLNDFAVVNHAVSIIGVGGFARLEATELIPNGKAILITRNDITIENLEFTGARVNDENGAGIRYEGGNLVIRHSYFHDNEDGILAASDPSGTITVDASEFARNGFGDGYTHGIYVNNLQQLTITDSYFHDTKVGHHIKSRASHTTLENNIIDDGIGGTASYSIDLPNGGVGIIRGNTITQSATSENPAMIAFGAEGNLHAGSSLLVEGNALINQLNSGVGVYNHTGLVVEIQDNVLTNLPTLAVGPNHQSGNTMAPPLAEAPWAESDGTETMEAGATMAGDLFLGADLGSVRSPEGGDEIGLVGLTWEDLNTKESFLG